jgi:hypothetical protein
MRNSAEEARGALISKGANIGKPLGCGQNGCVYQSARPGHVVKVDKGDNEARLANAVLKNPDLQGLRSIPKYVSVHETGVKDKLTGANVFAIEREDLDDLPQEISYDPHTSNTLDELSGSLSIVGKGIRDGSLADRKAYNQHIDAAFHPNGDLMRRVSSMQGGMFKQGAQDIVHMLRRGLVPCDLHSLNWGKRKQTGEVVMRDLGCFATAHHLK